MIKLHGALRTHNVESAWLVGDRNRRVQHLEHTLETYKGRHHLKPRICKARQWLINTLHKSGHCHQRANSDAARNHHECANSINGNRAQRANKTKGNKEHAAVHGRNNANVSHPARAPTKSTNLVGMTAK